jgi:hypothetical protein
MSDRSTCHLFNAIALCLLFFLTSCSGMEQSEQDKLRRLNAKGEFIHRKHDECHYPLETPEHYVRERYSWEMAFMGEQERITQDN